jgi:hypothetical protein
MMPLSGARSLLGRSALILSCLLPAGLARSDIPARDMEYVDLEALQALVLEYFGPCQAANFAAAIGQTREESCRTRPEAPRHLCLGGHNSVQREVAHLIAEAGRIKQAGADEFLARINNARLLRGALIARHGGDYDTRLSLETEDGKRYLSARHLFHDGRTATWRYPLPIK